MSDDGESGAGKQVIARAAAVIRTLEDQPGGLSLSQIAKASGLPRSTVQRIVSALEAQQFVSTGDGGVRLGAALARLAASAHTDVITVARPHIEALGRLTRETVDLSMLRSDHAVLVDQYASDRELRVVSAIGTAFPMHCTGHGKALLAEMNDDEVRRLLGRRLEARTDRSITSFDELLAYLAEVRRTRVAYDIEEHAEGVCGLGTAVRTRSGEFYAISLAAPVQRFQRDHDAFLPALVRCRAAIEASAGTRR